MYLKKICYNIGKCDGDYMSEFILIVMLLIIGSTMFLMHQFLEKFGLKIMLILLTIISLIMSFKIGIILGIDTNVNIIPYMSVFTIFYILFEKYSQKEVSKNLGLITKTSIYSTIIFTLFILCTQSINDSISLNINYITNIFTSFIPILLLPIFLVVTNKLYNYLKTINENIYINIIMCTISIGLIESIIGAIISNILILNINQIIHIALANYLLKIITIIMSLPIIYLIINKKKVLL